MNSSTQYKLVDENTDLNIPSDYDPLLKNKFEEYIQITERTNPGIRPYFNNIPDQATRDIHVSGLVLNWSDNLSRSKLRAVLERGNIENLYLYADTVIVGTTLCFPQTNVTIYARRLIMGNGKIDTTPRPFAEGKKYAQGEGSPKDRIPIPKPTAGSATTRRNRGGRITTRLLERTRFRRMRDRSILRAAAQMVPLRRYKSFRPNVPISQHRSLSDPEWVRQSAWRKRKFQRKVQLSGRPGNLGKSRE